MVSCDGRNVWFKRKRAWSTAAIGTDSDGRLLLIHTRSPYYTQDLINMLHMLEVMKESGWKPGPGFSNPPHDRVRLCAWEP